MISKPSESVKTGQKTPFSTRVLTVNVQKTNRDHQLVPVYLPYFSTQK